MKIQPIPQIQQVLITDTVEDPSIALLSAVLRLRVIPHRIVKRAQIVLTFLQCRSVRGTARLCRCGVSTVQRWVERWTHDPTMRSLDDLERSGRSKKYDLDVTARVLSIVSQKPADFGLVHAGWTQELIVEVLRAQGITVSRSTVQRILSRQQIDVRTVKYWLFTPRDREEYVERRDAICDLYLRMKALPADEIVVCFDAKPGMQILGDPKNKGGSMPAKAGYARRQEFEYRRLGTRSLVAAIRPDTGEVVHAELYDKTRRFNSAETIAYLERLRHTLEAQGYTKIHLVLDNGSTHRSKATTAYFGLESSSYVTYFTPVHASWLNLCENFFSIFSRRYLRNRRFHSVDEFVTGVPDWLEDHNARCRPLSWTYAPHQRAA